MQLSCCTWAWWQMDEHGVLYTVCHPGTLSLSYWEGKTCCNPQNTREYEDNWPRVLLTLQLMWTMQQQELVFGTVSQKPLWPVPAEAAGRQSWTKLHGSRTTAVRTDCSFPAVNEQVSADYSGSLSVLVGWGASTVLSEKLLSLSSTLCVPHAVTCCQPRWAGAGHAFTPVAATKWGCSDLVLTKTWPAFQHDSETWMLLLPVPWESWLSHFPVRTIDGCLSAQGTRPHTQTWWGHGCGHTDEAAVAAGKQPEPSQRRPLLLLYSSTDDWC